MAYDAYSRLMRPSMDLPEWQNIEGAGGSEPPDFSPFMASLKKRMTKQPGTGGAGSAMGGMFDGDAAGKAMAGGGPKSL